MSHTTLPKENRMVRGYRHRDKKNTPQSICDFDDLWLKENIINHPCIYCGHSKSFNMGSDRIDNNKGHIKSNIVPCCKFCNMIKNKFFNREDFIKIMKFCKDNNIEIIRH